MDATAKYTNLSQEEATKIVRELEKAGFEFYPLLSYSTGEKDNLIRAGLEHKVLWPAGCEAKIFYNVPQHRKHKKVIGIADVEARASELLGITITFYHPIYPYFKPRNRRDTIAHELYWTMSDYEHKKVRDELQINTQWKNL